MNVWRVLAAVPIGIASSAAAAEPGLESSAWQAVLGLAAVLAAIAASAWLLRRFAQRGSVATGALQTVAVLAVGPKERVVLVECQDTWVLVGVAPGSVCSLHSMQRPMAPQPVAESPAAHQQPEPAAFRRWLERATASRNAH